MSNQDEQVKTTRFCPVDHLVCLDGEEKCPICGGELVEQAPTTDDEIRAYSREAHNRDIAGYDKSQNALCFVVIGGILFVIGVLFVFLSLKKKFNKIVGIDPLSFQFAVCVICLAAGITCLTIGIISLIKALSKRKKAAQEIAYLTTLKRSGK